MKILLLILLLMSVPAWSADREVRDRNGTLIETWKTNGSKTEVRDRNSRLLETRTQNGNQIMVRDRNGSLLRTERIK
jgi:hypothetical protein